MGEIEALLYENERLLFGLAAEVDRRILGHDGPGTHDADRRSLVRSESSVVKHVVSRNVMQVTEIALSLTGNPGLSVHNPLQRHYRDALCSRVHTPQSDLVLTGLGKAALGVG